MRSSIIISLICLFTFTGCATPVYREVFNEKESYNSREFSVPANILYQATSRAVCAKNFIIEKEDVDKGFILAKRSFQRGKRSIVLVVQAKMDTSCNDKTMLYLSALQTTEMYYVSDHTRFFLFIVPLPGGGGKNASQVKEGEKVIDDKEFYKNFFAEIQREVSIVSANAMNEAAAVNLQAAVQVPAQEVAAGNADTTVLEAASQAKGAAEAVPSVKVSVDVKPDISK
ncbi:MAG: DUF2242 domain-containing protein [Candidatus Omnitrophota bacterium]